VLQLNESYAPGQQRPLRAYAAIASVYATLAATSALLARRGGRLGRRLSTRDALLLAVGGHKLSRLITRDKVTSFARAPFTRFKKESSGSEVEEEPRGSGLQRAVGELITCPYCTDLWAVSALTAAWLFAPRLTRLAATLLTAITVADVVQVGYERLTSAGA
jgi:Protein of unknown function (DUF1360)